MRFKKLFQLLVVGGAVMGGTSGCAVRAETADKKSDSKADAGTAADAGAKKEEAGGGAQGW